MSRRTDLKFKTVFCTLLANLSCGGQKDSYENFTSFLAGKTSQRFTLSFPSPVPKALQAALPGAGEIKTDRINGLPGEIHFQLSAMPEVAPSDLKDYAGAFLGERGPALGFQGEELTLSLDTIPIPGLRVLIFSRFFQSLPVRNAFVELTFHETQQGTFQLGKLINHSFGPIALENSETSPLTAEDIATLTGTTAIEIQDIAPLIAVDFTEQGYRFYAAKNYQFSSAEGLFHTAISDETSDILSARTLALGAKLTTTAYAKSLTDGTRASFPLPFVTLPGGLKTDINGFVANVSGNQTVTLDGPLAYIEDFTGIVPKLNDLNFLLFKNKPVAQTATISDTAVTPVFSEANLLAFNVFISLNRIVEHTKKFLTIDQAPILNQPIKVRLNVAAECNAFFLSTDKSLTLYSAGAKCQSSAAYNDIIYHEWGHGLDDATGPKDIDGSGITDAAFSEGISDLVSVFFTDDPGLGRGFFKNSPAPLRNMEKFYTEKNIPRGICNPDVVPLCEVHVRSQIFSGSVYALKKTLQTRYGNYSGRFMVSDIFYHHLLTTSLYANSYSAFQTLNGQIGTQKGPDFCLIRDAFAAHGLTEDPACTDTNFVKWDQELKLALASTEETPGKGFRLYVAAAQGTEAVRVCIGDKPTCLKNQGEKITFQVDRTAGTKTIYKAETLTPLRGNMDLTILGLKNNAIISANSVILNAL